MKSILILIIVFTSFIKSNGQSNSTNKRKDTIISCPPVKNGYATVIERKGNDELYVNLKLQCRSDNLFAEVIFINESSKNFWLYNSILPNEKLIQESFVIFGMINNHRNDVPLIDSFYSNHSYYFGSSQFSGFIVPVITKQNLILLKSNEKLIFNINLSKYYDFKSVFKKGLKEVYLFYSVNMPVIENYKHIKEKDEEDNITKPLYLYIQSKNSNPGKPVNYELFKVNSNCF